MFQRVVEFEGIHNFRDYGGYAARDGARLRTGLLYRSGQHVDATPADLERVATFGLKTVVDLRGDSERRDFPCARPEGFDAAVLFAGGETAATEAAPHVAAATAIRTAAEAHDAMRRLYASLPFRPRLVAVLRLYFRALAERDGPSLLHCFAGKDRTGVAAALLHALVGVHRDDAMSDYLLTNSAGNLERRIAAGAPAIRARRGADLGDEALRTLMSVDAVFLETALDAIRERHGSIDSYAEALLGVTPELRAAMEARLFA